MAAVATPTILDPKRLWGPTFLTNAVATLYTAPAAEAGVQLGNILLTNIGLQDFARVWDRDISVGYNDETADAADVDAADVTIFRTDAQAQGDEFYVGKAEKFSHIAFILSTILVGATVTLEVAYGTTAGDPGTYTVMTLATNGLVDGTNVLKQSGEISFVVPVATPWVTTTPGGAAAGFFIRLKLGTANPSTGPIGTQVRCGTQTNPLVTLYHILAAGSPTVNNYLGLDMPMPSVPGYPVPVTLGGVFIMNLSELISGKCDVENQVLVRGFGAELKD